MAAGEQWEGSGREEGGHSAAKRRRHGRALPAVTGTDVPPHRGDAQAAGATEHNRAVGPERADKSAVPQQATETEASRSSGSTVPATAGQTQQKGMGVVDQLVGQIDQLAETLVHLPPPSPKAAFATRAQGQAAQTVAQPAAQQHQPPPTAAQAPASRPEAPGVGVIPRTPGPSPGASDGTASRRSCGGSRCWTPSTRCS